MSSKFHRFLDRCNFQLLLSSLGLAFLREGLSLCHCAAVQFGGSLLELVCCCVEAWMLGGLDLCSVFLISWISDCPSCIAGAALTSGGRSCLGVLLKNKVCWFREFLSLHWICLDLLTYFKINFCTLTVWFSIFSHRGLLKLEMEKTQSCGSNFRLVM